MSDDEDLSAGIANFETNYEDAKLAFNEFTWAEKSELEEKNRRAEAKLKQELELKEQQRLTQERKELEERNDQQAADELAAARAGKGKALELPFNIPSGQDTAMAGAADVEKDREEAGEEGEEGQDGEDGEDGPAQKRSGDPLTKTQQAKNKKQRSKNNKKVKREQRLRVTEFDNQVILMLSSDGSNVRVSADNLIPLSESAGRKDRVEEQWGNLRPTSKDTKVQALAAFLENKPEKYCAFSRTITNKTCEREQGQTDHQACDQCVKLSRPCLVFINGEGELTLLPGKTKHASERYGYF